VRPLRSEKKPKSAGQQAYAAAQGVPRKRMPAEWEPQSCVHLAWPVNPADWPGKYHAACWAVAEIARLVSRTQLLRMAVASSAALDRARRALMRAGAVMDRIIFDVCPLDRGWMRDISPFWTVVESPSSPPRLEAVLFRFNGWARYPNHLRDAQWAGRYVREMALPFQEASWRGVPVVLEGGAVDSNGAGVLLATEECLLDSAVQTRNPGMSRRDYEDCFREYLGIRQVIWLNKGIIGDDTHGHVDDVCRFVGQNQVLLCREASSSDPNYVALEENRERLEGVKLPDGAKLEIISLPMPQPVVFDRVRLPASYANFLITNETVLVPTFNDPADRFALGIIAECFPDREVRGIHAVDLVWGLGTIHCLTKEEQLI